MRQGVVSIGEPFAPVTPADTKALVNDAADVARFLART